uniref:C2H2-type domain-containing protein n=1 Tax=Timema shepardi TaxID=629360 RepID=A0A7R9B5A2_TIMSH|nr:unnamed protein product [Timema shepardi]
MLLEHLSQQKEVCGLHSATEINSQNSSTKRGHINPSPIEDLFDRMECNICNKVYINKNALLKHKAQHEVERKCQVCNRSFSNLKQLKFHLKSHSQVKRYRCSKCSVSCGNISSLKIHNLVHTGERPFHCSECTRSFRRQTSAPKRTPLPIGLLGGHYHSRFPAPMGSSLFSHWTRPGSSGGAILFGLPLFPP